MRFLICFLFVFQLGFSQASQPGGDRISKDEYIRLYKDIAIDHMKKYGIPASITLAQGLLESGSGNSELAKNAKNHFGIKCHGWEGKKYYYDDDAKDECFRVYNSVADSYEDHALFLSKRGRYSFLFDYKSDDYKAWAKGLKKAGYATNPQYPALLIKLIEDNRLHEFDSGKYTRSSDTQVVTTKHKPAKNTKPAASSSDSKTVYTAPANGMHKNKIPFVIAKEGNTVKEIAKLTNQPKRKIRKYNDVTKDHVFKENEVVFIAKKKGRSKFERIHVVVAGENLRKISQQYGVRMKKLIRKNSITNPNLIQVGQQIKLR